MNIKQLRTQIKTPIFPASQVNHVFSSSSPSNNRVQLKRWVERHELERLKKGLYIFSDMPVDEYAIAQALYTPSYISLESALNHQGIIPDIPDQLTSVCTITSRQYVTPKGKYSFSHIKNDLFFGYSILTDNQSGMPYNIAYPEKALLDLVYIRNYKNLTDLRVDWGSMNKSTLREFSRSYPAWVNKTLEPYV